MAVASILRNLSAARQTGHDDRLAAWETAPLYIIDLIFPFPQRERLNYFRSHVKIIKNRSLNLRDVNV